MNLMIHSLLIVYYQTYIRIHVSLCMQVKQVLATLKCVNSGLLNECKQSISVVVNCDVIVESVVLIVLLSINKNQQPICINKQHYVWGFLHCLFIVVFVKNW